MPRIAVIGSGISGLAAAWQLSAAGSGHRVSLFEAGAHFGGHANTVALTLDGVRHGVDTGFLVYNPRTYPRFIRLLAELGIQGAPSEMSFSVQAPRKDGSGLEWAGTSLSAVFAQRRNLLRRRHWSMLADILRFNRLTTGLATHADEAELAQPVADFLAEHHFGDAFRDDYLLPMIGCIWSCPTEQMLRFPIATLIRFCHNHGLLQVSDRPQWYTVPGGSRNYVERMLPRIADARCNTPVLRIERWGSGVTVTTDTGSETFDAVVLACHSDQALALLGDEATTAEKQVLGSIRYQANLAVLHTDESVLPRERSAWAAWNYERAADTPTEQARVCLHYLINRLQPLPWAKPVIVSLNPLRPIAQDSVHARIAYDHPVFDAAAIAAQRRIASLQGRQRTWFAGAWCGYGFHEDGLAAGFAAADGVREAMATVLRFVEPATA
jgi:predicted NAD/FAD-binding protein